MQALSTPNVDHNRVGFVGFVNDWACGAAAGFLSRGITVQIKTIPMYEELLKKQAEEHADKFKINPTRFMIRAVATELWRYTTRTAIHFGIKDQTRAILNKTEKDGLQTFFLANLFSGAVAGALPTIYFYSIEAGSAYYAVDHMKKVADRNYVTTFNSPLHALWKTVKKPGGFKEVYSALPVSMMGSITHRALFFGLFDTLRPMLPIPYEHNFVCVFFLGLLTSGISGVVANPFDVVRRQMAISDGRRGRLALKYLLKSKGPKSLWKGSFSMQAIPALSGALALAFYDSFQQIRVTSS